MLGQRLRAIDEASSIVSIRDALAELMASGRIASADPEVLARVINGGLVDAALWVAAADDQPAALEKALGAAETLLRGLEKRAVG